MQYGKTLTNTLRGDFGLSLRYQGQSVNAILAQAVPVSATLGVLAYVLALLVGMTVGHVCGAATEHEARLYVDGHRDGRNLGSKFRPRSDSCSPVFGLTWFLLPPALVGRLQRAPDPSGDDACRRVYMAYIARLSRSGMLEVLRSNYIRTARAKGLPEREVLLQHALRGGLLPVVSFSGPALAFLLTGTVVVERIFALPGLGNYFINANLNRDEPLIIGIVAFISIVVLIFNLLVDIAYGFIDPRVRY